jgi:hypothetical protein
MALVCKLARGIKGGTKLVNLETSMHAEDKRKSSSGNLDVDSNEGSTT